ncbi:hypothetical protein B0H13DRAFT_2356215 [Mycena leptocephala]|nr:hypothetical protein B0H13DRAFT_2356215 [Mycena leptocephala]
MVYLPQELIDIIVDNLHDDILSLKSCSLTARTFVRSARTRIFNKIEIAPPSNPTSSNNPCQKLHRLLTSSPQIAPLVNELCIVLVGSETSFEYDSDGQYLEDRHITWIMARSRLSLILPLLDLKRISLVENAPVDWNSYGEFSMNWTKMGRQLKSALADVFSSPRLEYVHLRGIVVESPRQLLSLFSEATSLKEMSLSRLYFTQRWDQREPWPETEPWRPQLRSLLVAEMSSDPFCRYLINPRIDLSHIRSLTIATDSSDWREKLIQATNSDVEHLRLRHLIFNPSSRSISSFLGSNLRSIHFFTVSNFRLLDAFFKSCPHDACLEVITFEGPETNDPTPNDLSLNTTIESSVIHLRSLKMVEIKVYLWSSSETVFSVWSASVLSSLPSLVQRGMLTLTEIQMAEHEVHHGWE